MQVKSNCSSYPFQCIQTHIILPHWCAGTSLLETWTSRKAILSIGGLSKTVFQGLLDCSKVGLELAHGPLQGPQLGLRPLCRLHA